MLNSRSKVLLATWGCRTSDDSIGKTKDVFHANGAIRGVHSWFIDGISNIVTSWRSISWVEDIRIMAWWKTRWLKIHNFIILEKEHMCETWESLMTRSPDCRF